MPYIKLLADYPFIQSKFKKKYGITDVIISEKPLLG